MYLMRRFSRFAAVLAWSAAAGVAAGATPAFASLPPEPGGPAPSPVQIHTIVAGGMPGWQIALIAAGRCAAAGRPPSRCWPTVPGLRAWKRSPRLPEPCTRIKRCRHPPVPAWAAPLLPGPAGTSARRAANQDTAEFTGPGQDLKPPARAQPGVPRRIWRTGRGLGVPEELAGMSAGTRPAGAGCRSGGSWTSRSQHAWPRWTAGSSPGETAGGAPGRPGVRLGGRARPGLRYLPDPGPPGPRAAAPAAADEAAGLLLVLVPPRTALELIPCLYIRPGRSAARRRADPPVRAFRPAVSAGRRADDSRRPVVPGSGEDDKIAAEEVIFCTAPD